MTIDQTLDRREAILVRLHDIGQHDLGVASAQRNHGPAPTGLFGLARPAFLLYDGDARLTQDVTIHKNQRMPPTIWSMDPQIVILLKSRDTIENVRVDGTENPVGPELSSWFNLVNEKVTNDPVLIDLVTPNGMHFLTRLVTDMKIGRQVGALGAWLMMQYEFRYPLFPPRS